jgi:hypothetical protein
LFERALIGFAGVCGEMSFDKSLRMWEYPTMKIAIVDAKKRLVLPGALPGEAYTIHEAAPGQYELAKVIPAPRVKPTARQLDVLLKIAPLTPKMSWEELRSLTREP